MSWLTNQIFAKQIDRVKSGLQYFADFARLTVWAVKSANLPALEDVVAIGEAWFAEAVDEAGQITLDVVKVLFGGGDPFKASRQLLEVAITKYTAEGFTLTSVTKAAGVAPVTPVEAAEPLTVTPEVTHGAMDVPGQPGDNA